MIGALVAVLSLNLTAVLIQDYGVIAKTLPITGATVSTPILVTSTAHGQVRPIHGIVSGVTGEFEANGLWVLTPVDANTLALSTFTAQGLVTESVGVNAYTGGGQVQYAFPDGSILLGRRNVALATSVASPRIIFVPTDGKAWNLEPFGGAGPDLQPAESPAVRGSLQQQSMTLGPQLATEYTTFEVYVTGSGPDYGNVLSPDFNDLDATQAIVYALYSVLFDASGPPRAKVLHETWPSQLPSNDPRATGTHTQRGQQWMGIVEFQQPVQRIPKQFVPIGTYIQETVEPINAGSTDGTIIVIHQQNGP
jgi:hypothetical protein